MSVEPKSALVSSVQFARLLAEALGLSLERVVRIELVVDTNSRPTLTLTRHITEGQAGELPKTLQCSQFELVPKGEVKLRELSAEGAQMIPAPECTLLDSMDHLTTSQKSSELLQRIVALLEKFDQAGLPAVRT